MGPLTPGMDDCRRRLARVDVDAEVDVTLSPDSRLGADEVEFITKEEGTFLA